MTLKLVHVVRLVKIECSTAQCWHCTRLPCNLCLMLTVEPVQDWQSDWLAFSAARSRNSGLSLDRVGATSSLKQLHQA